MELKQAIEKIESFKELKQNWNTYDANPFTEKLINKAIDLVKQMNPTPFVSPTGRDSIQFEWEIGGLYLEMEIYEDKIEIYNEYENRGETTVSIEE